MKMFYRVFTPDNDYTLLEASSAKAAVRLANKQSIAENLRYVRAEPLLVQAISVQDI